MTSPKLLHVLCWVPLMVIGLASALSGLVWLVMELPRIQGRTVHMLSGILLLGLGAMICAYVLITFMGTRRARNTLLSVLGIFMAFLLYLEYTFIPASPFVILTYALWVLYGISLWATVKLNKSDSKVRP